MADCVGFQAQIASIIEVLANSAVTEICSLVEDGYAALRAHMQQERQRSDAEKEALRVQMQQERQRSDAEKEALRDKLRDMEEKMRSCDRRTRRRSLHALHYRPPAAAPDDLHPLVSPPPPASSEDPPLPHLSQQEEKQLFLQVKQEDNEADDCNLDLKVELNIRAECGLSAALETSEDAPPTDIILDSGVTSPSSPPSPTDTTVDLTCRARAKRRTSKPMSSGGSVDTGRVGGLKLEVQTEASGEEAPSQLPAPPASGEPSPDRIGGLGLDLTWMQERVTHLGAAYAVAQLGLNSDTCHPPSFPSQGGGDNLDSPPTMLFTGGAHEIAAFAASFDMAAAAAAVSAPPVPPRPLPAAPSAPPNSQRQPYRTAGGAKDAACSVCGRGFPSAAALELHQRVHTGERPYTCPHCGKGFAQPNNLRVHLLIHTGERRYRCSLCGKSFISSSHLKRHRTVHTQEKPYSCSRCGQAFSQMCSVRRHRQQSQCGL